MQEKFVVTGMTCAACSAHVERAVGQLQGVNSVAVNLMLGSMLVDYDPQTVTAEAVIAAVRAAATAPSGRRTRRNRIRAWRGTRRCTPCAAGWSGRWCALCRCSI